jgi:alanyl-tRNA synthetase
MQPETQTQKLYEADAYRTEMAAHITAVRALPAGGWAVALDATVFFPEGGGQSADTGTLAVASAPDAAAPLALAVTDVHEQSGVIWHTVAAPDGVALSEGALPVGAAVAGRIDGARRFDQMQQHTGEHILSGILHQMFGAENVGFHIGSEAVRMDTSVPIPPEGLREAELAANRVVWQDVPVQAAYPTPEELARLTYRSKKELDGPVRIVTIPGADVCACCGTHTATSGQVGQIKILAAEHYKGGMRLAVVCGERALRAAQAMRGRQAKIGALLSAKAEETANAVQRVYDAYTQLKFDHFGLCAQLFDALAAGISPAERGPQAVCIRTVPGLDSDGLHRLAARLCEATDAVCVALTPTANGTGYCLAQTGGDVRALTRALNAACNGRGGGKPGICQGSCTAAPQEVEAFLRSAVRPEA